MFANLQKIYFIRKTLCFCWRNTTYF